MRKAASRVHPKKALLVALFAALTVSGCDLYSLLLPNNASLASLGLSTSGGATVALSPVFSSTTLAYKASVASSVTKVLLSAAAASSNAVLTVTGASEDGSSDEVSGTGSLSDTGPWLLDSSTTGSSTTIHIIVAAQNSTETNPIQQIYSLTVTRED
jgi:hypothetical protein